MLEWVRKLPVFAIWTFLSVEFVISLATQRWSTAFVCAATIGLSLLPVLFASRFDIRLPRSFLFGIVLFVFATIYLGELGDFYERYWWWDVAMHAGSAMAFGLMGFLFVFMMFEGDRYAAPPIAITFLAFCVAVTIGAVWEIFEFAMDQLFGFNMQKSGLVDTMGDLIVDCIGAAIGAAMGFLYLKGRQHGGPLGAITEFVLLNRRLFRKAREMGRR